MTTTSAPTSPIAERPIPGPLGVDDNVAQAFRSAAHAFQVQAAALSRGGRMVAFASPSGSLTMTQVTPALEASTDVAVRGSVTRFFSPPDSDEDLVLYATPVRGDLALVALFSMDTPLGNARRTGQALVAAILRAGAAEPPAPIEPEPPPPALPRDWIPESPTPGLERTLLPELPPPAAPAIPLPKDWIPGAPATEDRLPFLKPPEAMPAPMAPAPVVREVIVRVPAVHGGPALAFSLVLMPRFPEHRLTGALVQRLRTWVHRLCLAWDWRAERVEIQPDHLALSLTLEPDVAPGQVVQQLQDGLAARVLQTFPQLADDLPSGRFWASTFLLQNGPMPGEAEIAAFVRETRSAQGFSRRT